jgi:hypothetical protein
MRGPEPPTLLRSLTDAATRCVKLPLENGMIKEWLNRAGDRSFGFLAALLMRRAVASLSGMNDAALREAGLSRAAVTEFLATPPGTDPGAFFTLREQSAAAAAEQRLVGQRDARDGPKRRNRRRSTSKRLSSKSTLRLAKEIP